MSESASNRLRDVEFTYEWYREFLGWLRSEGYRVRSFGDTAPGDGAFLRHDVDLSVDRALRMARIEAELGVRSTYFVLLTSPLYNLLQGDTRGLVREIEALGHDVGLHFSTHAYWPGDEPPDETELVRRVEQERDALASVIDDPAPTVSFHIPPDWVLDRTFDAFPSTYEPALLSEIGYRADSTQRWRERHPLERPLPGRVQLLVHPGLWGERDATFEDRVEAAVTDACRRTRDRARREFASDDR